MVGEGLWSPSRAPREHATLAPPPYLKLMLRHQYMNSSNKQRMKYTVIDLCISLSPPLATFAINELFIINVILPCIP
jgi:hypothetical protein